MPFKFLMMTHKFFNPYKGGKKLVFHLDKFDTDLIDMTQHANQKQLPENSHNSRLKNQHLNQVFWI